MKPILPVSHLIDEQNFSSIQGINRLEYKSRKPILQPGQPSCFHGSDGLTQSHFLDWFNDIAPFLEEAQVTNLSFDIGPSAREVEVVDHWYQPKTEVLSSEAIKDCVREGMKIVREKFKGTVSFENLNYFPTPAYEHVCDANFISEVHREMEVGLVFDMGHAMVSAHNFGMTIEEYALRLPLDLITEIHISAPDLSGEIAKDAHGYPGDREWKLLEFLLEHVQQEPFVAIEYYKSLEEVSEAYQTLIQKFGT